MPSLLRPRCLTVVATLLLLLWTSAPVAAESESTPSEPMAPTDGSTPSEPMARANGSNPAEPMAPTDGSSGAEAAATATPAVSAPPAPAEGPPAASEAESDESSADASADVPAETDEDRRISEKVADAIAKQIDEQFPVKASYGSKGFRLETRDGNWQTNLQWRAQFRFTYPFVGDPRQVDDFDADNRTTTFEMRRLRMKIGGFGYRPWLKYYFELDLEPSRDVDDSSASSSVRLIDWRVDIARFEKIALRVGQWKIDYNRERVDSSGRQEFVERSIVNRIFTIDRQVGLQLRGRLFEGTPADLLYFAGLYTGEGRGTLNDDNNLLYSGRLQWNFLGRDVPMRQTDVERTPEPAAALGGAIAYNIGPCTRWSSGGCGALDGFAPPGDDPGDAEEGQFKILQAIQDFAFKWQGLAIQEEFHWKHIDDRGPDPGTFNLFGSYAQVGYFFHGVWEKFPKPLEFAFRYAWLREPNEGNRVVDNTRQEFTAVANWFFAGHNNKLTLDYSYLTLDDPINGSPTGNRVRLQWDVSF